MEESTTLHKILYEAIPRFIENLEVEGIDPVKVDLSICGFLLRLYESTPNYISEIQGEVIGQYEYVATSRWVKNLEVQEILDKARERKCSWVEEKQLEFDTAPEEPPIPPIHLKRPA